MLIVGLLFYIYISVSLYTAFQRHTCLEIVSFFIAAPVVWNSLPLHLHSPSVSRCQFWAELKTHLCRLALHWLFLWELLKRLIWTDMFHHHLRSAKVDTCRVLRTDISAYSLEFCCLRSTALKHLLPAFLIVLTLNSVNSNNFWRCTLVRVADTVAH